MANSDPHNGPELNPFVAFRRLVDHEIKSLFRAFGVPELDKSTEINRLKRFGEHYERATNPERTNIQPRTGETEKFQTLEHGGYLSSSFATSTAHSDSPDFDPQWEYDARADVYKPTVSFFQSSEYSPLCLQARFSEDLHCKGSKPWCEAFADLLAVGQKREDIRIWWTSLPKEHWTFITSCRPRSYIQHLQSAGFVSPRYQSTPREQKMDPIYYTSPTRGFRTNQQTVSSARDQETEEMTEIEQVPPTQDTTRNECVRAYLVGDAWTGEVDLPLTDIEEARGEAENEEQADDDDYDDADEVEDFDTEFSRYMALEAVRCEPLDNRREEIENAAASQGISRRIIAQTTKIERQVHPDGTVMTRRVFRKRFDDGSEENEDTTETTNPVGEIRESTPEQKKTGLTPVQKVIEERKKGASGWFWST